MRKPQKEELILRKAEEYARSGNYINWLAIEHQLRSEGLTAARQVLDREILRERLDALCKQAGKRQA